MNSNAIKALVDDAERAYHRCWATLSDLRRAEPGPHLVEFQHDLGRAMQSLEAGYQALARRRQRLIGRKSQFAPAWFRTEQVRLAKHQEILHQAIGVGYSLGDAFAWFFYQFDRRLLDQHGAHERQSHPPAGVGGQAELAAVAAFVGTDRYIPIYHGITTILRMGDITLVDIKKWRVAAIGEVKTTKPDSSGKAELTVTFMGHRDDFPPDEFHRIIRRANRHRHSPRGPTTTTEPASPAPSERLSDGQRSRLRRQLSRTEEGLKVAREASPVSGGGINASPAPFIALEELASTLRMKRFAARQLDGGLVALAYRSRYRSLFARLSRTEKVNAEDIPSEAMEAVRETIIGGSAWNHIVLGQVQYDAKGLPVLLPGTLPVAWWPINATLARDILFHSVTVLTVWNPASLLGRLQAAGLTVDGTGLPHRLRLTRTAADGRSLSYVDEAFWRLIPTVLAREEDVAETITRFLDHAQYDTTHTRLRLQTVYEYFPEQEVEKLRRRRARAP